MEKPRKIKTKNKLNKILTFLFVNNLRKYSQKIAANGKDKIYIGKKQRTYEMPILFRAKVNESANIQEP